jgi:hypothetical protein
MTTSDILVKWLISVANSQENWFYSYDLESRVPTYGRLTHQKVHTASTYSRAFRKLRESNTLKRYGYKLEEIKHNKNDKVKGWKIEKNT